jgi:hypothetical protein
MSGTEIVGAGRTVDVYKEGAGTERMAIGKLTESAYFTQTPEDGDFYIVKVFGSEFNPRQEHDREGALVKKSDLRKRCYLRPEKCAESAAGALVYRQSAVMPDKIQEKVCMLGPDDEFGFVGKEHQLQEAAGRVEEVEPQYVEALSTSFYSDRTENPPGGSDTPEEGGVETETTRVPESGTAFSSETPVEFPLLVLVAGAGILILTGGVIVFFIRRTPRKMT